MNASPGNRRYTEREIQTIFRRATERQEAAGSEDPHRGLTLEELKSIGAESGIDPAHIERAASDLEKWGIRDTSLSPLERFYGTASTIRAERIVPGRMDDATWNEGVAVLQSVFNTRGHDQSVGPLREWSAFTSSGFDYQAWQSDDTWYTLLEGLNLTSNQTRSPVHFEARPDGEETRITASYRMPPSRLWEGPGILGGFWGAALVITLLYPFVSLPVPFLLVPLGLFLVGGGLAAYQRQAHRSELRTTRERIDKALDRIGYLQASKTDTASETHAEAEERTRSDSSDSSTLGWEPTDDTSSSTGSASGQRERS